MAYCGSNDDSPQANAIYASYVANIKCFVRWLVDNDRGIRLLVGDANGSDDSVVQEILADLRTRRPNLPPVLQSGFVTYRAGGRGCPAERA